jgi:hypothetical protein
MFVNRFDCLALAVTVLLCYAVTPLWFQNDTFYTIKTGEWIVGNGIDMMDHFSWHELPYTYPHWAYSVFIYLVYAAGGFNGIYVSTVVLCAVFGIILYVVNRNVSGNRVMALFVTAIVLYVLKDGFITARAQLVSYVLLLLTVYFIERFIDTGRRRFPVMMFATAILIANVHVAVFPFFFVLFLPYIGEYFAAIFLKRWKGWKNTGKLLVVGNERAKWLVFIAVACLAAGLITPTGDTPYTYLYKTVLGTSLQNIAEHRPLILILSVRTMLIMLLFFVLLVFTDVRVRLKDLLMVGGLLILTLGGNRHLSLLAVVGMISFGKLAAGFLENKRPELTGFIIGKMLKRKGLIVTIAISVGLSAFLRSDFRVFLDDGKFGANFFFLAKPLVDERAYPVKACDYITDSLDVDNIRLFNEYNHGSYLMFRNIPVFVDSRADLYTSEFNGKRDILKDFFDITRIKVFYDDKFEEYGITHVLIKRDSPLTVILSKDIRYRELYWDDYVVLYSRDSASFEQ